MIRGIELEDKILIVDDEKMIYSIVAQRLAKEGCTCVMASLRPHRRAMPVEDVLLEMEKGKGR